MGGQVGVDAWVVYGWCPQKWMHIHGQQQPSTSNSCLPFLYQSLTGIPIALEPLASHQCGQAPPNLFPSHPSHPRKPSASHPTPLPSPLVASSDWNKRIATTAQWCKGVSVSNVTNPTSHPPHLPTQEPVHTPKPRRPQNGTVKEICTSHPPTT